MFSIKLQRRINFHIYDCKRWWRNLSFMMETDQRRNLQKKKMLTSDQFGLQKRESRWLLQRVMIMISTFKNIFLVQFCHCSNFATFGVQEFEDSRGRRIGFLFFFSPPKWQALREHHQLWRIYFSEYTGKPGLYWWNENVTVTGLSSLFFSFIIIIIIIIICSVGVGETWQRDLLQGNLSII